MTTQSATTSLLDSEPLVSAISGFIRQGETNASIVRRLENEFDWSTTKDSIRRFRRRHGLNIPGTEQVSTRIQGDTAEATMAPEEGPHAVFDDPDRMLLQRGLDPNDWYIDSPQVNEWEGLQKGGQNKTKLYQTKFTAKRKRPELAIVPARSDGWKPPKVARRPQGRTQLVVVCGDQQAPFHDRQLHDLFCGWLEENKPDRGVNLGDLTDMPDISRHPRDPENVAAANECLQAGYDIFRGYVNASPITEWELLEGNHDERIRQYLLNYAPNLWSLKRADSPESPGEPVHGLTHLLRLDELGIRLVEPHGTYEDGQVELSKYLAVRHGWIVRQGSGATALKTLEQTGYSLLIGHTHRQSLVHHTMHDIDRKSKTLMAAEVGCMCRLDGARDDTGRRFPSYTVLPDWQRGFATATIYPDGKFRVDLATYFDGTLLWRDQRYTT